MPIVVDYNPSAATVGQSAYQAGLGDYRKYQDQLGLQTRQLDQQQNLALLGMVQGDLSQIRGIRANENALGANLANSQWQTMAGIAGQDYLQQQRINADLLSQQYGAGVGAAMQSQQLQTNALLSFQDQLYQNERLIKQLTQQQASQQYAAAVDVGMQAQRLQTGLQGQAIGIAADMAQQDKQIFASGMQQQVAVQADADRQAAAIAAERQNTIDQLKSGDWRTQYGASIDQQNLAAQISNNQWMQGQDLEAARARQEMQINENIRSQLADIEAKKTLQQQAQQVEAVFRNQDVAVQQQNLMAQLQARQQEMAFEAYTRQQLQMAEQMASERMALFQNTQQNARLQYQTGAELQNSQQSRMYDAYRQNMAQQFEAQQNQMRLDTENRQASETAEYRKQQMMSQLMQNQAQIRSAVAQGNLRPEEADAMLQQIQQQMGVASQTYVPPKQLTPYQQYEANSWTDPATGTRMYYNPNNGQLSFIEPPDDPSIKLKEMEFKRDMENNKYRLEQMRSAQAAAQAAVQGSVDANGMPTMKYDQAYDQAMFDMGMTEHRKAEVSRTVSNMDWIASQYGSNPGVLSATQVIKELTAKASQLRDKQEGLTLPEAKRLKEAQALVKSVAGI